MVTTRECLLNPNRTRAWTQAIAETARAGKEKEALGELRARKGAIDAARKALSACADAWPPVIVDSQWSVGPGLDTGVFSTVRRDDGTEQLVAGKFPLYDYSGDAAPGDRNGQGSGDVWFIVGTDAKLVKAASIRPE